MRTVESVDRCKGYLSTNKWIWRAIDKVLAEEENEQKGVKGLESHQVYEHLNDTTASVAVEPKQSPRVVIPGEGSGS